MRLEIPSWRFREARREDGLHLEACEHAGGGHSFPDAEYLITLDADSLLLPDYALRLIHAMEQPGNERLAVAQTPYSSIPAPAGSLESIAGATTDIQYIIHQGFTAHHATYWVGANALLRKRALHDIAEPDVERGHTITRYIQDRTVIEDTESSIDLVVKGWRLYNYPERLAYSATPPDFGSLLIQRRRWANGGLIILPKLLRHVLRGPESLSRKLVEGFFRTHYLVSIAAVNIGLLIMFAFPFEDSLRSVWLPLSALPYFYLYARDLVHVGYRWSDVFRVYALNHQLRDQLGQLGLALGGGTEAGPFRQRLGNGPHDPRMAVPENERSPRSDVIHVTVAVDVHEMGPLAAIDEWWLSADAAERPGRTPESYTVDHSAQTLVFDATGRLRLLLAYGTPGDKIASDFKILLNS